MSSDNPLGTVGMVGGGVVGGVYGGPSGAAMGASLGGGLGGQLGNMLGISANNVAQLNNPAMAQQTAYLQGIASGAIKGPASMAAEQGANIAQGNSLSLMGSQKNVSSPAMAAQLSQMGANAQNQANAQGQYQQAQERQMAHQTLAGMLLGQSSLEQQRNIANQKAKQQQSENLGKTLQGAGASYAKSNANTDTADYMNMSDEGLDNYLKY